MMLHKVEMLAAAGPMSKLEAVTNVLKPLIISWPQKLLEAMIKTIKHHVPSMSADRLRQEKWEGSEGKFSISPILGCSRVTGVQSATFLCSSSRASLAEQGSIEPDSPFACLSELVIFPLA